MRFIFLTALLPILAACISNMPTDLKFVSVEAVDWRDQDELPGPGASPLIGLVDSRTLIEMGQSIKGGEKSSRPLLKIGFTSAINLPEYVTHNSYNLGNTAFRCGQVNPRPGISSPGVFWRGIRLGPLEENPITPMATASMSLITYYFFANVTQSESKRDLPPREGYDLRQKAEDICFYLAGGNNSGFGYKSNVVVVPKDAIAEALKQASR